MIEMDQSTLRERVLSYFEANPGEHNLSAAAAALAPACDTTATSVRGTIGQLARDGLLRKVGRGRYSGVGVGSQ